MVLAPGQRTSSGRGILSKQMSIHLPLFFRGFPAVYEDSADVLQILQGEGNSGGQGVYMESVGHGDGVAQPGAVAFVFYLIPGLSISPPR